MELAIIALVIGSLIAVNALFVLAEFAIVRVRPSRVSELVAGGVRGSVALLAIQQNLDEHLGVCQIAITLASVALGVASQRLAELLSGPVEHATTRYVIAIGICYLGITGSHIVVGELLPKAIAIRSADEVALRCAYGLRLLRAALFPILWLAAVLVRSVARVVHLPRATDEERHTAHELRILLGKYQAGGNMSLRRLIVMENVLDFGQLRVRDVMCLRDAVHVLHADASWKENLEVIRRGRFTRYPLLARAGHRPIGFVHVKDIVLRAEPEEREISALVRPLLVTSEDASLESIQDEMHARCAHAALVFDAAGDWTGFVTLEDIVEEIAGADRDEFDDEVAARLGDALSVERIQLGVEASSVGNAVRDALGRIPAERHPVPAERMVAAVEARELAAGTYIGQGVAIPHARLAGLAVPFAMILRSERGVPCVGTSDCATLLFVLFTPSGRPRVHQALLQAVAMVLRESRTLRDRIHDARSPGEVLEIVREGEEANTATSFAEQRIHHRRSERPQ